MAIVKILIEGHTTQDSQPDGEESTCPTITLIQDNNMNAIVDPGSLPSQGILIKELKKEGLSLNDINLVFITHSHIDHYKNVGMFPNADVLEYWGYWYDDKVKDWDEQFTEDIKIIKTPGHNYDGITILVRTDMGIIAICGDVFWKEDYPKKDPYASDPVKLEKSRKIVKKLADYIIPGHGGMIKNPNKK